MIKIGTLAIGALAILIFAVCGNDDPLSNSSLTGSSSTTITPATPIPEPVITSAPAMSIDPSKGYSANIVTEKGEMLIKLFAEEVPNTVFTPSQFKEPSDATAIVPGQA